MDRSGKTEPVRVCIDADVIIAGLMSRRGASYVVVTLGNFGLLRLVVANAAVAEVRRNVAALVPAALPSFEEFLLMPGVDHLDTGVLTSRSGIEHRAAHQIEHRLDLLMNERTSQQRITLCLHECRP